MKKLFFALLFCPIIMFSQVTGTGFAIHPDGYIATCFHVIEGKEKFTVNGVNGDFNKSYDAIVVKTDKMNDLAILKLDVLFDDIPYGFKEDKEDVAAVISAIGFPLPELQGYEVKITSGIISSNSGLKDDPRWYQHSASIQQGNSGGPLINEYGNIVGINNLGIDNEILRKKFGTETQNVFYAIKSRYLINLIEDLELEYLETNRLKNLYNYYFNDFEELYKDIKKYVFIVQAEDKEKIRNSSNIKINSAPREKVLKFNFSFNSGEGIIIFGKYQTEAEAIAAKQLYSKNFTEFPVNHFYLPEKSNSNEEVYMLYLGPIKGHSNVKSWSKLIDIENLILLY